MVLCGGYALCLCGRATLWRWLASGIEISGYIADVIGVLAAACETWNVKFPTAAERADAGNSRAADCADFLRVEVDFAGVSGLQ